MVNVRVICALAIIISMSMTSVVYGGPARSLAAVVAARTIKIPRTIRAPFRNDQIMTARGFGKRSQQFIKFRNDESNRPDNEISWDNNKYDKQNPAEDQDVDLSNIPLPDNYALEWIMDELKANPMLLRSLLEHIIDRKHDDHTATQDLYGKSTNKPTPFY